MAPPLNADLGPGSVNTVESLKVTTTLTNTGDEAVKILNDPLSPLSKLPAQTFKITKDATGATPSFIGIKAKYVPAVAAANGALTVLAPGQYIEVEHNRKHYSRIPEDHRSYYVPSQYLRHIISQPQGKGHTPLKPATYSISWTTPQRLHPFTLRQRHTKLMSLGNSPSPGPTCYTSEPLMLVVLRRSRVLLFLLHRPPRAMSLMPFRTSNPTPLRPPATPPGLVPSPLVAILPFSPTSAILAATASPR